MNGHELWVWFRDVALDGLVGAVVGAAVVIWALRRTIKNEDDQRREERNDAAADVRRAELQDFRRQMASLYATLERLGAGGSIDSQEAAAETVAILRAELILLQLEARRLDLDLEAEFVEMRAGVAQVDRGMTGWPRTVVGNIRSDVLNKLVGLLEDSVDW